MRRSRRSQPAIEARGHQLQRAPAAGADLLEGDLTRLAQVFSNLLNNAAKYTSRAALIAVEAQRETPTEVVVAVRDTRHRHPARHAAAASSTCSRRSTVRSSARKGDWGSG